MKSWLSLLRNPRRTPARTRPRPPALESLEDRYLLSTAPFAVAGTPRSDPADTRTVDPLDFRVTTFASGLNYPEGMVQLADGSLLVGTSRPLGGGTSFYNSAGDLLRFVDANRDGVADGPPTALYSGLPGSLTALQHFGNYFVVTSSLPGKERISFLHAGATPAAPLTLVGSINFAFPSGWEHTTYGSAFRPTPGRPGDFDLFFNVGSQANFGVTTGTVPASGLLSANLHGDAIYMVTVHEPVNTGVPSLSNLTQVATGLRNAAGIIVDPATGDLVFEDNGIDGFVDPDEPESADELNRIAAADIGGAVENFGFSTDYIQYRTGKRIGSGAIQPLIAFQPIPDPQTGSESEGASQIALSPAGFPAGLNNGVFLGFHGRFNLAGVPNEENPFLYADPATGQYLNFISNDEPNIGHLDGVLANADSLFISDIAANGSMGSGSGTGVIYQVRSMASIVGRQFNDLNGNGVADPGEPGLAGWTVFLDANNNGVLDPGEVSTTTDANGNYRFSGLEPGAYRVREVAQAGWTATTAPPAAVTTASGAHTPGGDFGTRHATAALVVSGFPSPATASVAGTVTVTAQDAGGNVTPGYTGTIHFTSSDPQAVLPADYTFTIADAGSHTFAVTLKTAGTQSLTATDTAASSLTGTQTGITVNDLAQTLFADDFSGSSLNPAWKFAGGSWAQSGGVMAQTSTGSGDPKKALVSDQSYPANLVVTARVRVDSWAGGDYARAGVSLDQDPATGNGYNLVFHNNTSTVQFLDDHVAWGNAYAFNWSVGTWYWFQLEMLNGVLYGKVWQDGTPEPASWMFTQAGWTDRTGGAPGLNGGANNGATASFDDVSVRTPAVLAAPTGLTATAASTSQVNLSWNSVGGATAYAVQRSPDGSSGWAEVASGLTATSFADTGLRAGTTYYYRVLASDSAGSGPFSATASATTQPAPAGTALFADDFNGASVNPAWKFAGGSWAQSGGVLSQTGTGSGDPKKALVSDQAYPANLVVTARVRVDSWTGGDWARAGVSLGNDPATGRGYNLVFHNDTGTVQFLYDAVTWGNAYRFNWAVGTWYWFQLEMLDGTLYGKVWADGTPEPAAWMFTQAGWAGRPGAPGLNGGSNNGATASFDDLSVTTPAALAAPMGLTATPTSASQINLSWNPVSGATAYAVQRSPDGSSGWAQVASGLTATGLADTGLRPGTTYYYRVQASSAAGSGPFSATASATTQPAPAGTALFADDFSGAGLNPAWKFAGGSWAQSGGVMAQTSTGSGDPKKALVSDQAYPANLAVTARVRVDSWAGGDFARAGVSLDNDPASGRGYNLVFHNDTSTVQFLDDGVTWGNAYTFNWSVGAWYWFKLEMLDGVLYGKVWADGTPEPAAWMFTQAGWADRTGGAPGLNGGSNNGATASFDDVSVTTA